MTRRTSMDAEHSKTLDRGVDGLGLFEGAAAIEMSPIERTVEVRAHLRKIDGAPKPTGEERKHAALDAHETDRVKKLAIDYVRAKLAELYRTREMQPMRFETPFVNGDDVDRILNAWAHRPKALDGLDNNWRGAIFRKGFETTGQSFPSTRPHMNGTRMLCWRVRA